MKIPDGVPPEIRKMLEEMGLKSGRAERMRAKAYDAIGAPEIQALIGSEVSFNFLQLMGRGLFKFGTVMTTAEMIGIELVKGIIDTREEHDKTCPKDHRPEIRVLKELVSDLEKAFEKCRDNLDTALAKTHGEGNGGANLEDEDDMDEEDEDEAPKKKAEVGVKLEDVKLEAPKPETELVEFDALMRTAIAKAKMKKPFKIEAEGLVSLLTGYKGKQAIMQKAQALIAGKGKEEKVVAINKFIKSIA